MKNELQWGQTKIKKQNDRSPIQMIMSHINDQNKPH